MLIVTGYMQVDPSEVSQFRQEMEQLAIATRARRGNLSYDTVLADPTEGLFLAAERWTDQMALSAHLQAEDTKAFLFRWQGRMRGDVKKYDASNEREIADL